MKKILMALVALTVTMYVMAQMTQQQQAQKIQQQMQQQMTGFYKYQFTFINEYVSATPFTVKLQFADGTTSTANIPSASAAAGPYQQMAFASASCLTDMWVSGQMPTYKYSTGGTAYAGNPQPISTDHHGLNICGSKQFIIQAINNSPYVQVNWTP